MRRLTFGSTLTIRLPDETRALVEAAAEREGASASGWVRRALATAAAAALDPNVPHPAFLPRPADEEGVPCR